MKGKSQDPTGRNGTDLEPIDTLGPTIMPLQATCTEEKKLSSAISMICKLCMRSPLPFSVWLHYCSSLLRRHSKLMSSLDNSCLVGINGQQLDGLRIDCHPHLISMARRIPACPTA